jgi:hypothetical protein
MSCRKSGKSALGAWLAATALTGAAVAGAPVASADVSVGVDVAPVVTVSEPQEVTVSTEPPDPVYEERMDAPGPGYAWVGGSWGWTGSEWGWYPGRWLLAPEGRVYVEPYYERVGPNVVYVRGYWGPPGAPRRYYGGERIRFAAPARPAEYRRGQPPRFERRAGVPAGSRPAGFYEHAAGPARPLPHAGAPPYRGVPRETPPPHPAPGRELQRGVASGQGRVVSPERSEPRRGPAIGHPAIGPAAPPQHAAPGGHSEPGKRR